MSFLEARKTAVFFIRDFFDKYYGSLKEIVRFDFRYTISGAQPSSSHTINMYLRIASCQIFAKLRCGNLQQQLPGTSPLSSKTFPMCIAKANIWSYL